MCAQYKKCVLQTSVKASSIGLSEAPNDNTFKLAEGLRLINGILCLAVFTLCPFSKTLFRLVSAFALAAKWLPNFAFLPCTHLRDLESQDTVGKAVEVSLINPPCLIWGQDTFREVPRA